MLIFSYSKQLLLTFDGNVSITFICKHFILLFIFLLEVDNLVIHLKVVKHLIVFGLLIKLHSFLSLSNYFLLYRLLDLAGVLPNQSSAHMLISLDLKEISVCTQHTVDYPLSPFNRAMGTND